MCNISKISYISLYRNIDSNVTTRELNVTGIFLEICLQTKFSIIKVFLLPTDAQENSFQNSIKIYIKITIAPTYFGVITIIRERTM